MRWPMKTSTRLSFANTLALVAIAGSLVAAGCGRSGRGSRPLPLFDAGMADGNVVRLDLGPRPDGDVSFPDLGPISADCGDSTVDAGEECDDGGASASCDVDCTFARCGDRTINPISEENCDDGNTVSGDGCSSSCQREIAASCGDSMINGGEQCDDGPSGSGGCDPDCTFASCGDFTVNTFAGEQCDAGAGTSECDPDCTLAMCGDGFLSSFAFEACDDGNLSSGDGCSAVECSIESGWTCSGSPSRCMRRVATMIDRTATPGLAIPDASTTGISSPISVTGAVATACAVDSLTVDVNITHPYIGDLSVMLTSPTGTTVILHDNTGSSGDNIVGNYPLTLTPAGTLSDFGLEPAAGSWTLQVVDGSASDTGRLNSWALHITCL